MIRTLAAALATTTCIVALATPVAAQTREYNIPAGSLKSALDVYVRQSGRQVVYRADQVRSARSPGARGQLSAEAALADLLSGSGFTTRFDGNLVAIVKVGNGQVADNARSTGEEDDPARSAAADDGSADILVTGTRIRGGDTPSPVIRIGAAQIREEGFTDLGEVIRSVPQNFTGGQNPGVISGNISGAGIANQNVTGGSSLNLRGLGPDATLTLLNGRRMAYGGFSQTVDISAIPVEAVERLEIVADGASAIYGSDAVGGVANVILKRDYEGVRIGARYGGATDGGLTTREFSATGGVRWSSGGLIATYKDSSADPIYASQRSYTDYLPVPLTIYPASDLHNGLVSVHQAIGSAIEVRLDAFRTERDQRYNYFWNAMNTHVASQTTTTFVAPSVEVSLPNDWTMSIGGSWAQDEHVQRLDYRAVIAGGATLPDAHECYCNKSIVYEVGAEGPMFALPGDDARLAIGAGYRENQYRHVNYIAAANIVEGDEGSRFAYAEINLPFIGPVSGIRGIRRLVVTAAVRGEDYDSFGSVITPKLGAIYEPSADFTLKASWGKSFKAPTLHELNYSTFAYLLPPGYFGGTGYPQGATVLLSGGGNPNLGPERANTWTTSLAFHPEAVGGLEVELTFFDVKYMGRVRQPVANFFSAMIDPNNAPFFDYYPSPEAQANLIAGADIFSNATGAPYDPTNVVAILHAEYVNVARQDVRGVDVSGSYRFAVGSGEMSVRGSASWLDSQQQTTPLQAPIDLAGTLFNPASLNVRAGAVWRQGGFNASAFVNYTGGVKDIVNDTTSGSFTTVDATLSYITGEAAGALSGLELALSAQNLFDRSPPLYMPSAPQYIAPFDATNYSAIGRFLSVSISKRF